MKFELDKSQADILKAWQAKIKRKYGEYGYFEYRFMPTGIGTIVVVYSRLTGKTLNLSDYENW